MKQRLQNLAIAFVSTMISLIFLEIALQIIAPPPRIGVATLNAPAAELYGWALFSNDKTSVKHPDTGRPIPYTTNSRGWKDVEHQLQKPEGVVRIVFVGDSNTFAITPLEDGFTRQVERLLHEQGFTQVEVISIAVGAWGTDQILEALRLEGVLYDADFIIHQFSDNDIVNNIWPEEGLRSDSIYWHKLFRYEIDYPDLTLRRVEMTAPIDSWNVKYKRNLLKIAIFYYANLAIENATGQQEAEIGLDLTIPYDPTEPYYRYTTEELTPEAQYAWALFEAMIVEMRNVSEESGAQFLIYSPNGDEGIRQWSMSWGRIANDEQGDFVMWDGERYGVDIQHVNRQLEGITTRYDIPLILPTRAYQRYEHDHHPDSAGNVDMARDVVDYLLDWEPFVEAVNASN